MAFTVSRALVADPDSEVRPRTREFALVVTVSARNRVRLSPVRSSFLRTALPPPLVGSVLRISTSTRAVAL